MKIIRKRVWATDHVATGSAARRARIKAGLSVREVARRTGFSAPFISDLEKGRRNWTEYNTRKYNNALL